MRYKTGTNLRRFVGKGSKALKKGLKKDERPCPRTNEKEIQRRARAKALGCATGKGGRRQPGGNVPPGNYEEGVLVRARRKKSRLKYRVCLDMGRHSRAVGVDRRGKGARKETEKACQLQARENSDGDGMPFKKRKPGRNAQHLHKEKEQRAKGFLSQDGGGAGGLSLPDKLSKNDKISVRGDSREACCGKRFGERHTVQGDYAGKCLTGKDWSQCCRSVRVAWNGQKENSRN